MIEINGIVNLVDQYAKHGWTLRRVLLSEGTFADLSDSVRTQFPDTEPQPHEIDALWFSRKSKGSETWELRRIGSPPFALVEVIEDDISTEERENRLAFLEHEMADKSRRPSNFGSEFPRRNL
jgi:hypothetical protein